MVKQGKWMIGNTDPRHRIRIRDIAAHLPEQVEVTNGDLHREHPDWGMSRVAVRTGVLSRRVARSHETALDLAIHASTLTGRLCPGMKIVLCGFGVEFSWASALVQA